MPRLFELKGSAMIVLHQIVDLVYLHQLPKVSNDNGHSTDDGVHRSTIDIENILNDPRLYEHGYRGPGLGYRRVAKLTVCLET